MQWRRHLSPQCALLLFYSAVLWLHSLVMFGCGVSDSEQCAICYCVDTPGCMVAAYDGTTCYPKRLKNINRAWLQADVNLIIPTGSLFACTPSNACLFSVTAHALAGAPLSVKHENILGPRLHSVYGFLICVPFCRLRPTTPCWYASVLHCVAHCDEENSWPRLFRPRPDLS